MNPKPSRGLTTTPKKMIRLHQHADLIEPNDPNPLPIPTAQAWAIAQDGMAKAEQNTTATANTTYAEWDRGAERAVLYIQEPAKGLKGRPYSPMPEHAFAYQAAGFQRHSAKTPRARARRQIPSQTSTFAQNASALWKTHVFGNAPLQNTLPRENMDNATIASTADCRAMPKAVRMRIQTPSGKVLLDTGSISSAATEATADGVSMGLKVSMLEGGKMSVTWRFKSMGQVAEWCGQYGNALFYRVAFGSMVDKRGRAVATAWSSPVQFKVNSVPGRPSVY